MTPTTSFAIAPDLFLVRQPLADAVPAPLGHTPTNHVVVIDCSGSMSGDLPKLREQLKKKIPHLLAAKDTLSVLWFSGRGEFGTLLEAEPLASLKDLQRTNELIDRWLRPVGLTGFKEPLEEVTRLVERVRKSKDAPFSLFFMTDGCDNQWSKQEVLEAVTKASGSLASATFVEYGYYADRALLSQMAERAGGDLIFAEDFPRYEAKLEGSLALSRPSWPRVNVKVKGEVVGGFVFALSSPDEKTLLTFGIQEGVAQVPADIQEVWFLSPTLQGKEESLQVVTPSNLFPAAHALYATLSLFATRCKPDIIYPVLKKLGDVRFIDMFQNCFGKQRYTEFQEEAKEAVFLSTRRFAEGYNPSRVPPDDAFCILDLLRILESDENNALLFDHPDFSYSRIGRARLDASSHLTVEESAQLEKLTEALKNERNAKKVAQLTKDIAALTDGKKDALTFTPFPTPAGFPILDLTWNEDRPNISVLVRKKGSVDLSRILPAEFKKTRDPSPASAGAPVPEVFPTFIFRNYAIVKDGLVNVDKLPARITLKTFELLKARGGLPNGATTGHANVVFDLRKLPVLNRKMVGAWKGGKGLSATEFFTTLFRLTQARAEQKVWNSLVKEAGIERESKGFAYLYGAEAAKWLQDHGLTDYGGFAPKMTLAESTDFYLGKELKTSIKGYSTLPSLKDAREKLAKGKPNGPTLLMAPAMEAYNAFVAQHPNDKELLTTFLKTRAEKARAKARGLLFEVAKTTFVVIVGQVWFREFSSVDEGSMQLTTNGLTLDCKVEMRDVEIKV